MKKSFVLPRPPAFNRPRTAREAVVIKRACDRIIAILAARKKARRYKH